MLLEALEAKDAELFSSRITRARSVDLNVVNASGRSALHLAAGCAGRGLRQDREAGWADTGACKLILERSDFKLLNSQDALGHTALHYSCERGLLSVCVAIFARFDFAGGNEQGGGGWTALHDAARTGSVEICALFLAHPGFHALRARDRYGRTALGVSRGVATRRALERASDAPAPIESVLSHEVARLSSNIGNSKAIEGSLQARYSLTFVTPEPLESPHMGAMTAWLSEVDEHLLIYLDGFERLGLKSPEHVFMRHVGENGELDSKLFELLGVRKLGHIRLLQRWLQAND